MSKSIKVSDEVYSLILRYQGVRESQSSVIKRAFAGFVALDKIKSGEWPPQSQEKIATQEV